MADPEGSVTRRVTRPRRLGINYFESISRDSESSYIPSDTSDSESETLDSETETSDSVSTLESFHRPPPTSRARSIPGPGVGLYEAEDVDSEKNCTLLLVEGESAKRSVICALLRHPHRSRFGILPLQGKRFSNVLNIPAGDVITNSSIIEFNKALGLEVGREYSTAEALESLRYRHICLLFDNDSDGCHIQMLVLGYLHTRFRSLLDSSLRFVSIFHLPYGVGFKPPSQEIQLLNNESDYDDWAEGQNVSKSKVTNLSGIDASVLAFLFQNITDHQKFIIPIDTDTLIIEGALKRSVNDKGAKNWKADFKKSDISVPKVKDPKTTTISAVFIDCLESYSAATLRRTIPFVNDGLKPKERKVIWRGMEVRREATGCDGGSYNFIKEGSILSIDRISRVLFRMRHLFPGTNNVPLLSSTKAISTREFGPLDYPESRYIMIQVPKIIEYLFKEIDTQHLKFECGEPKCLAPVVPIVLLNGTRGTSFTHSTYIPSYNPIDIIENIIKFLKGKDLKVMIPFFNGFRGHVNLETDGTTEVSFEVLGIIRKEAADHTLRITELPIGTWTRDYTVFLEGLRSKGIVESYTVERGDPHVEIVIKESPNIKPCDEGVLMDRYKLVTTFQLNMNLLDENGEVVHYQSSLEILKRFCLARGEVYKSRWVSMKNDLKYQISEMEKRIKFITAWFSGQEVGGGLCRCSSEFRIKVMDETVQFPKTPEEKSINQAYHSSAIEKLDKTFEHLKTALKDLDNKGANDLWLEDLKSLRTYLETEGINKAAY